MALSALAVQSRDHKREHTKRRYMTSNGISKVTGLLPNPELMTTVKTSRCHYDMLKRVKQWLNIRGKMCVESMLLSHCSTLSGTRLSFSLSMSCLPDCLFAPLPAHSFCLTNCNSHFRLYIQVLIASVAENFTLATLCFEENIAQRHIEHQTKIKTFYHWVCCFSYATKEFLKKPHHIR